MKGVILENLGASRYRVGVSSEATILAKQLKDVGDAYDQVSKEVIAAYHALSQAQATYFAAVDEMRLAVGDFQLCLSDFDEETLRSQLQQPCLDANYLERIECLEGDPEQAVQCLEDAQARLDACLAKAELEVQKAKQDAIAACEKAWAPKIAALQKAALALLPSVQSALYEHQRLIVSQLALGRRFTELQQLADQVESYTVFKAQYDDSLAAETEVMVAKTPAGRHVITEIGELSNCLHKSRPFPSFNLFVNAALATGAETWLPTWRTGKVLAIEGDELRVQFDPGTLPGSLGTLYSRVVDCTPPQAFFDGNAGTAEQRIRDARQALADATEALKAVLADRKDCIAQYDQTWVNGQYNDKVAVCKQVWDQWLLDCRAAEG